MKNTVRNLHSPTMLKSYLSCEYIVYNEKNEKDLKLTRKERSVSDVARLNKGNEHEKIVFNELKKKFKNIKDIKNKKISREEKISETLKAMKEGVDLIYGGFLNYNEWMGEFDFLIKDPTIKTEFGSYGYEIVDAKNTTKPKADHIVQLGMYSLMLEHHQKQMPQFVSIALKDNITERIKTSEIYEFFNYNKDKYEEFLQKKINKTKPVKCSFCSFCDWEEECEKIWIKEDNINQVAGINSSQIRRLAKLKIETLSDLAKQNPLKRHGDLRIETTTKLIEQAKLQHNYLKNNKRDLKLIENNPNLLRGFNLLPKPSDGDIFFDMESVQDYVYPGGLEYLFGLYYNEDGKEKFKAFWAHNKQEEKKSVINFFDFLKKHFEKYPDAYIYHYASYELSALNRLTSFHKIKNADFDKYLRLEKFVDLFKIVKQSIQISENSYSLKFVEKFYDYKRTGDVVKADQSGDVYVQWVDSQDQKLLNQIEHYNMQDCQSTFLLREWLLSIRPDHYSWYKGQGISENADEIKDYELEFLSYQKKVEEAKIDKNLKIIFSDLIGFYRREARPEWRMFFERKTMSHEDLVSDAECIGDLTKDAEPTQAVSKDPKKKLRSSIYTYKFPEQDYKIKLQDKTTIANEIYLGTKDYAGEVFELDAHNRIIKLKKAGDPLPDNISISRGKPRDPSLFEKNIFNFMDSVLEKKDEYKATIEILNKEIPDVKNIKRGDPIIKSENFLDEIPKTLLNLNNSYIFIQGPPGTGKTYQAANAILKLLELGKKVAVNGNSHKVINNLLARVEQLAIERKFNFYGIKKSSFSDEETLFNGKFIKDVQSDEEFIKAVGTKGAVLFAGTKWHICKPYYNKKIDYLFIDEAGQISLSDVVAMGSSCKNIVLVGDQMQLGQPSKGVHPGDSGKSILDYLLGDLDTINENRGIFLNKTYRLDPKINNFISDNFYESRLIADENNSTRKVISKNKSFSTSGIYYIASEHSDNSQKSEEECQIIKKLYKDFIGADFIDLNQKKRKITDKDILIISPYNVQVNYLKSELDEKAQVGTIDKFQGQEAPITIISMTSSDAENLPRDKTFFFNRNRLNVAISRSQCVSIILFNPKLLETAPRNVIEIKLLNNFFKLMKFKIN